MYELVEEIGYTDNLKVSIITAEFNDWLDKFINEKNFYLLIILFLFFVNLYANNINDFQIESISLGEMLQNILVKWKLKVKKRGGFIYPKKDFYSVTFYKTENPQFETYDAIQLHLKLMIKIIKSTH